LERITLPVMSRTKKAGPMNSQPENSASSAGGHPQPPELSADWLAHADQAVADLDPTGRRLRLLHEGVKPDWSGAFGPKLVEERALPGGYGFRRCAKYSEGAE
jgi:hypothetical protein